MFINKKIGLTFLLILLFLLIGGSSAFAYTGHGNLEWFEAYIDFSLGVDFGIKMSEGNDPEFSWGFNSSSFRADKGIVDDIGGGDPSIYIRFYMTLSHGDMNTGEGYVYMATTYMPERGVSRASLGFLDIFGYGNHLFVSISEQYHNIIKGVLYSGMVYGAVEFELAYDKILSFSIIDFHNNGVNENGIDNTATGITAEPGERPDSWQMRDGQLESPNVNADTWFFADYYWFINPTMLFFGEIGFTIMKNPFNNVDNMINGFPGSGVYVTNDIWYGSYLGVPDDEKQGFEKDLSTNTQVYFHKALPYIGILYGYVNADLGMHIHATIEGTDTEGNERNLLNMLTGELSITAGADIDNIKAIPGFSMEFRMNLAFLGRKEITIEGDNETITFPAIPFKSKRFEIQFLAAYTLPIPISMTPNLHVVIDLAEFINAENHNVTGDPLLAWSAKLSWDIAFGMGQITMPIYIRFSNIPIKTYLKWEYSPWSYRLTIGEGNTSSGAMVPEGPDDNLRIVFGTGIKFSL